MGGGREARLVEGLRETPAHAGGGLGGRRPFRRPRALGLGNFWV